MKKIINTILPFDDFLYLLQLEEYDSARYLKLLRRFYFRRNFQKRGKLVKTSRIKTTSLVSVLFFFLTMIATSAGVFPGVGLLISVLTIPVHVLLANVLLSPVYESIKSNIQRKAFEYFKKNYKGKVIAVAGSYGKTTVKNYIYQLIGYNHKTQMVPGNINTPTGIAVWVRDKLELSTEYLIVEMDTYFVGEIKRSALVAPPDIAILTNIGDQHLERLGSKKNLANALLEVFEYSKSDATLIYPKSVSSFINKTKGKKYVELKDDEPEKINKAFAREVAKLLKIPNDIIKDTEKAFEIPDRRHKEVKINGFSVIDDSYNISYTTAVSGLERALKLAKLKNKDLVVITGGIAELGVENKNANKQYAKRLKKEKVDVILMKTVMHDEIENVMEEDKLTMAEGMSDALEKLNQKFDSKKKMVLMQPEFGDNYY